MPAGAVRVCIIPPSVKGPKNARKLPECGNVPPGELVSTPVNPISPNWVQPVKLPVSKPPLTTMQPPGVEVGVGVGVGVELGEAVGVGDGVPPARLNAPIRNRHPIELVVGTYSFTTQKVWSSVGSISIDV